MSNLALEQVVSSMTIEIQEAQTRLDELVPQVAAGTALILTDKQTPVVRLVPLAPATLPRVPGLHLGAIWTREDFDEPLPDAFWTGTE